MPVGNYSYQSLGRQMLNAPLGINGLRGVREIPCIAVQYHRLLFNWINTEKSTCAIEIRLHLPSSDTFGTERDTVRFQIKQKIVNAIEFRLNEHDLDVDFSV